MAEPRMTDQVQHVLRALLIDLLKPQYGLELSNETGLATGTLYPILTRLTKAGWVEAKWEELADDESVGRPRRRYYQLTRNGAESARIALAEAHAKKSAASASLRPKAAGA